MGLNPKPIRPNVITIKEASQAILKSGYLLESRIESLLIKAGFYVEANSAYPDPTTKKSRELDLYAMQAYQLTRDYDFIFSVLLIECINNIQPIVFFNKEPLEGFFNIDALKLAGLPVKIFSFNKDQYWISLVDFLHLENFHHYCKGKVATQFCSFSRKRGTDDWIASHEDMHFDAFTKLCDATDYYIDKQFKSWVFDNSQESINIEFYNPVLVVQGQLIEARPTRSGVKLSETNHIQFRRTSIVLNETTEHQIDVVTENYFLNYLKLIENEFTKIRNTMKRKKQIIRKSVSKIVNSAKRLKSPEKIRKAFEY